MGNEEKNQKADILKENINALDNEIKNLNIERIYLQKLRKERDRLQKIKQTMDIFVNMPELKKSLKSFIAAKGKDISLKEGSPEEDKGKSTLKEVHTPKNDISILLTWIMMAISVVVIICAFLPWFEINGIKINIWDVNTRLREVFSLFESGISEEMQWLKTIILVADISIWACVLFYGFAIYKLSKNKKTDAIYSATMYIILIIIVQLLAIWGVNEKIRDAFFDFSVIKIQLSTPAWVTLILSCVLSVTYYVKNNLLGNSILDDKGNYGQPIEYREKTYKFAVTNYCLWTTLNLLSVNFVKKADNVYMSFDYIANSYISNSEKVEKDEMNLTFGIQIETEGGICYNSLGKYQIQSRHKKSSSK